MSAPKPERLAAAVAAQPYAAVLGVGADDGETATVRLPYRDALVGNPMLPALHGGVIGAFVEPGKLPPSTNDQRCTRRALRPRSVDCSPLMPSSSSSNSTGMARLLSWNL